MADVFYLSLYPAIAVGLVILIRRRTTRGERGVLVDATTVTTGLGLLAWVFRIHPAVSDETLSMLGHVVSVSYPVGDVVLAAMVVRLLFGGGSRPTSYWLISASLLAFLAGDTGWAVANQVGWEPTRYGGEEFILLMPDTDTSDSVQVIERLRGATPLGQTFSAGVATWNGDETSDEVIARADAALYGAKRGGRDRGVTTGAPATGLS